jgi:hypothetical protein
MKLLFTFIVFAGVSFGQSNEGQAHKTALQNNAENDPLRVDGLSQELIGLYSKTNSCYLPLLKDPALHYTGSKVGFEWYELFNNSLAEESQYKNRYLVGDFMALNEELESRGIEEKNPDLEDLVDFKQYGKKLFELFDAAERSASDSELLYSYIRNNCTEDSIELINFYKKVWRFKTPPFVRKFSRIRNNVYASGQRVCLCEAHEDTLLLIAQYATSSKRLEPNVKKDSTGKVVSISHVEYLPIGKRRRYYASQYRITSKNWERDRKYEKADMMHDKKLGGGNQRVTYYKGKAQLPNFLLMEPTKDYPKAMHQNGIHEVALRELSRGMLGTANSIGCIRLSDFGSKFTRWWVPQDALFFVLYTEDRYHKKLSLESIKNQLPFKNELEGNLFRKWLHKNKPLKAKQMNIDIEGSYDNGFILDTYNLYGQEYEKNKEQGN